MKNQPPCIQWSDKLGLRNEDLSFDERTALEVHLYTCKACSNALIDYNFLTSRIGTLPPPTVKPFPRLALQSIDDAEEEENKVQFLSHHVEERSSKSFLKTFAGFALVASIAIISLLLFRPSHPGNAGSWNPESTKITPTLGNTTMVYRGHSGWVNTVLWSHDGKNVASIGDDHVVRVWNARTGDTLLTNKTSSSTAITWSPDSTLIAFASENSPNTIQIENINMKRTAFTYNDHGNSLLAIAWSPDGKYIVSVDSDNSVQVLDVGKKLMTFTSTSNSSISSVAWSPNSSSIALASYQGTIQIWDAKIGAVVANYRGHTGSVSAVVWSPDGKRLASASYDNTVRVWDVGSGKTVFIYKAHNSSLSALTWSPDGKFLASGDQNGTIQVWNAIDGGMVYIHKESSNSVNALAWSPDGRYIASSTENVIRVWRIT